MTKKLLIPLTLAVIAALLIGGVAYAANNSQKAPGPKGQNAPGGERPGEKTQRGLGQITAIGEDQFTVQRKNGEAKVISVDENTRYFDADRSEASFADLKTGQWVAGRVISADEGLLARLVILLPEGLDPSRVNQRARGEVTAVGAASFTLHTPRGEDLNFAVDGQTTYMGEIHSLADVQTGMKALVGAQKLDDGSLVAVVVGVRADLIRHAGTVTEVDPAASTFSLQTVQGETLTFRVDDNTQFLGPDGSAQSLDDMQPGMLAAVAATQGDDGSYLAVRVASHERPEFDLEVGGRVTAIDTSSFDVKTRDGQQYTFQVTPETRFRSRGGAIQGLKDLRIGMFVGVGAQALEDGQYQALMVLARAPKK
jgi:hypothetical protein